MPTRTRRKNLQKRRKRRLFAAIASEILSGEMAERKPEQDELENMRNEEERQRTHQQWAIAVQKSAAAFNRKTKILAQRQQLLISLRQNLKQFDDKKIVGITQQTSA
ncbi:hypothetical protein CCR75_002637 [Bremia lactucae]|uniref:Uncharacterized protein n=1 Tax=Bremia lactucae TaxID=4779 RepID=A0A976IBY8_BRELC|nr:hypothetical protein CCR75_002637 [Bremia lactucae]